MLYMITYQVETYESTKDEVEDVTRDHWNEVPFGPWGDIGLDINHPQYDMMEQMGSLRVFTARDDGVIIGYLVIVAAAMLHHKEHWHATDDVIYVAPDYRGSDVFNTLVSMAVEECKRVGIHFFTLSVNPNYDFSSVMEKMGWVLTEKAYTVRLN